MQAANALHKVQGQLAAVAPFSFEQSLAFLGLFAPTRGEQTVDEQALVKAVMVRGKPVVFRVSAALEGAPGLDYTLYSGEPLGADMESAALDRVRFYLSLDDDLSPFYALAQGDTPFLPVVERCYGYHQVKFLTPLENACWAVLTQRNAPASARAMKARLVERYGGYLEVEGTSYAAFPQAGQMPADAGELAEVVGNSRKGDYLAAVVRAFRDVDEGWLRTGDYTEVEAWLLGIKGLGAWSASFVLLRGLGRMERVPVGEGELLQAARRVYGDNVTEASLGEIAARYGPFQGYWAHYLRAGA